jgi:hypothetical protein
MRILEWIKRYDYLAVSLTTFFIYNFTTRLIVTGDEKAAAVFPWLLINYHTIFYDPIYDWFIGSPGMYWGPVYQVIYNGVHYVSIYPLVTPILITPLYLIHLAIYSKIDPGTVVNLSKFSATCLMTVGVLFFYLATRRLWRKKYAVITTAVFAFGTLTWALSSQTLWQHATSEMLLCMMLYFVIRNEGIKSAWNLRALGILAALFAFNRPSDGLLLIPIFYYVFWAKRTQILEFLMPAWITGTPFAIYNLIAFDSIIGGYQSHASWMITYSTHFGFWSISSNVIGFIISPSRGLFVFMPVLLLAISGIYYLWKENGIIRNTLLMGVPAIILTGMVYSFFHWWDGSGGYGPRYLTGMLPFLALYTGYTIKRWWDK